MDHLISYFETIIILNNEFLKILNFFENWIQVGIWGVGGFKTIYSYRNMKKGSKYKNKNVKLLA